MIEAPHKQPHQSTLGISVSIGVRAATSSSSVSHKVLTNVSLHLIRESLRPEDDRLTPALKAAGYRLGAVGKWHVNQTLTPLDFGYDDHVALGDYMTWRRGQGIPIPDAMLDYTLQRAELDPAPAKKSRPAWLADRTIKLLERCSEAGGPWLLRLDFHGPHFPNVVPEPWKSLYDPAAIPPWPNAADDLAGKPAVQCIKQRHWRTGRMSWADWKPLVATYFGEVSLIEAEVGRVLARLDELGLAGDTLVVWTTDHGDTIGAHGICKKDYRCRAAATGGASCRSCAASRSRTGQKRRSASSTAATWGSTRCGCCAMIAKATSITPTTSTSSTTARRIRTSSPTSLARRRQARSCGRCGGAGSTGWHAPTTTSTTNGPCCG